MLNLDQKQKFQKDISNYNVTIYPLVIIDNEINISTVNESLLDNETDKNPIIFKDYALKLSNIKESINVDTHKFKISNVTLSFNNYEDSGQRLSDLMIGKISKQVVVYFKTQSCNYLSDCLIVYKGIIKRFNHDDSKISLTLEDLTDKVVHKDLPSANMNFGDHCLNKDLIDKYIPMTYGYVKKAPMIPYLNNNSTSSEGLLYLIPDDVDEITTSNRGIRVLHAKDPDAKANLKCKLKYKKIVGDKLYKHKSIIKCLNNQLKIERDNLGYLQNLETWINNHTWEKYENINENDGRKTNKRITRSL